MQRYTESGVIGINCKSLQGPKTDPAVLCQLHTAMTRGQHFHGEILNYRQDSPPFWNELSIKPVLDARGVITQYVAVQRDVTAGRQVDADLVLAAPPSGAHLDWKILAVCRAKLLPCN